MDIITTHLNADFDALGSMIAAKKIYPEAVLVFPGSQEKSLRRFFLESVFYMAQFEKIRRIDLKKVRRLILVDIRQRDRIGRFEEIVDSSDVEVHIYDHHPPTKDDIKGELEFCKPAGATVSIMVQLLRWCSVALSPEEATILMLGIYEDTGSLTFSSTTVEDFEAAAYLLNSGADLNAVSNLITSELTQDQLVLLHELAQSRKACNIHGIEVNLAEASANGYVGDLAVLVHKLRDMENFDVLFVLARMENRVFLVGRSRIAEVDVGEIARDFGGGGHPTAASATIKEMTLFQTRERLMAQLNERVKPKNGKKKVHDYMSYPVISLQAEDSVRQAQEVLSRYNINSFPILEVGDRLCGIINRQVIEKAAFHGLAERVIREIMSSDFTALSAEDPIEKAYDLLLGGTQRFTPVLEGKKLVGVLTRMDVIQSLASSLPTPIQERWAQHSSSLAAREKRVTRLMNERLPKGICEILRELGKTAENEGMNVYLVGGLVRDLLLRRNNLDIDIVVEGDGILFADKVCELHQARKRSHSQFGTAKIIFQDGFRIDVATARLEYYDKPAALPNVEWSSLKLDLYRRDFTMNTVAIRLNPGRFGELVDFFGGQKDIKDKVIRVIQNLSFIEDPTRIFRAIRFSERFGFALGSQTKYLMQSAIQQGLPSKLDGRRLFAELKLILQEEDPFPIIDRMQEIDLMRFVHPQLVLDQRLRAILGKAREVSSWFRLLYLEEPMQEWVFYLLCLLAFLDDEALKGLSRRWGLHTKKIITQLEAKREAEKVLKRMAATSRKLKPSEIYHLLHPLPIEALLFIMTKTSREKNRKAVSSYITKLRSTKISVTGKDLVKMGYTEGPQFREIMKQVLDARLNGLVTDRTSETVWVDRHFPDKKTTFSK